MPYTLMKGLVWIVLAVLLGILIGWFLRSVAARRQVRRARVDQIEVERLRGLVADLEPVVAERDRLLAELESRPATRVAPGSSVDEHLDPAEHPAVAAAPADAPFAGDSPPGAPDVADAAAVFGSPIDLDDLKVIEGIGPKIEELCHGIGIRTWLDLSTTEVSLLRTMLADAGSRFRSHDPSTWPEQAALLASGRWADFVALTDELSGGRAVD